MVPCCASDRVGAGPLPSQPNPSGGAQSRLKSGLISTPATENEGSLEYGSKRAFSRRRYPFAFTHIGSIGCRLSGNRLPTVLTNGHTDTGHSNGHTDTGHSNGHTDAADSNGHIAAADPNGHIAAADSSGHIAADSNGHADADSHTDTDADSHTDANGHADADSNGHTDADSNADAGGALP